MKNDTRPDCSDVSYMMNRPGHIERVPNPIDDYARQMFECVTAVCSLPNSEGKDRLLAGLSHAIYQLSRPLAVFKMPDDK
ncbi:MAG: hypothetical protein NTX56_04015 [Proteobacteria bacterium]|nr:hypothetical protein [Pseudomonadota bacterium]